MPWPRVDHGRGFKWSRHLDQVQETQIQCLCGKTDLYQSKFLKFRYGIGRCQILNSTRLMGPPSFIVFQILILLKGFLICYSNSLSHTHTHTLSLSLSNMHLKQTNMTYHPQIQHSSIMTFNKHHQGQQTSQSRLNKYVKTLTQRCRNSWYSIKHIKQLNTQTQNACSCDLCMTYLTCSCDHCITTPIN